MNTYNEGLVLLEATVELGLSSGQLAHYVDATVFNLLQAEADIFAFIPQEFHPQSRTLGILIEFCDLNKTIGVISGFNGFTANVSSTRTLPVSTVANQPCYTIRVSSFPWRYAAKALAIPSPFWTTSSFRMPRPPYSNLFLWES